MFIPLLYSFLYIMILLINFFSVFIFKYYNDYYLYLDKTCNDFSIELYKYRYNIGKINLIYYKNIFISSFWIFICMLSVISVSILFSNNIYLLITYITCIIIYIFIYYKLFNIYTLDTNDIKNYKSFYKNLNGIVKYIISKEDKIDYASISNIPRLRDDTNYVININSDSATITINNTDTNNTYLFIIEVNNIFFYIKSINNILTNIESVSSFTRDGYTLTISGSIITINKIPDNLFNDLNVKYFIYRDSDYIYKSDIFINNTFKYKYIIKFYNENGYETNNIDYNNSKSSENTSIDYTKYPIYDKSTKQKQNINNTIDLITFKNILRNMITKYENIGNKADIEYFLENILNNNDFLKYFILNNNYIDSLDITDDLYIYYKYYLDIDNLYIKIDSVDYNNIKLFSYDTNKLIADKKNKINIKVLSEIIEDNKKINHDDDNVVYTKIKKYYNKLVNDDNGINNLKDIFSYKNIIFTDSKYLYKNIKTYVDNNLYYIYVLIIIYICFLIIVLHIILIILNINYPYIIISIILTLFIIIKLYEIINR